MKAITRTVPARRVFLNNQHRMKVAQKLLKEATTYFRDGAVLIIHSQPMLDSFAYGAGMTVADARADFLSNAMKTNGLRLKRK